MELQDPPEEKFPGAFFSLKDKVKIRKGDKQTITIQFMPFYQETFRCQIVFVDKNVGEF